MKAPKVPPPLSQEAVSENNRHHLTLAAMADVEVGDVVSHKSIQAWAARVSAKRLAALSGSQPDLEIPLRRQQKT